MPRTGTNSSSRRATTSGTRLSRVQAEGPATVRTGASISPASARADRRRHHRLRVARGDSARPRSGEARGARLSRLRIGRRMARRRPYSTATAQASTRATRQTTSSSKRARCSWSPSPPPSRTATAGSARYSTHPSPGAKPADERRGRQQDLGAQAVGGERDFQALDRGFGDWWFGRLGPSAAAALAGSRCTLMIAFKVAAKAARLAGSFNTSSAAVPARRR